MRGFLSALLFVMVPSWLFAQGGVTTTDDYDAGARSPELFQPGEEAEALLLMPLQAYSSAFSSLSDFNFSFVRYNRRGYDSRYSMLAVDGIALDDPLTGNQHWNVLNAVTNAPGPLFLAEGGAPGERMLGLSGGIREYGRLAGEQPKRAYAGAMFTDRRFRSGAHGRRYRMDERRVGGVVFGVAPLGARYAYRRCIQRQLDGLRFGRQEGRSEACPIGCLPNGSVRSGRARSRHFGGLRIDG